jgi:hypothetical protein
METYFQRELEELKENLLKRQRAKKKRDPEKF